MQFVERDIVFGAVAATAQTLPYAVAKIVAAASFGALGTAGDTETALTVVTGTPAGAEVQFSGTPEAPSTSITLGTAAAAGQILKIRAVVQGDIPAYL